MKALLLILFPALLCAETITSSASCSGDGISVTGTTSCQIGQPYSGYAYVNQSFYLSVGGSGISASAMSSAGAEPYQTADPYFHTIAFLAQGSFQITEYFTTLGSGTGYMEGIGLFGTSQIDGGASGDLLVGYPGGGFVGGFFDCAGAFSCLPNAQFIPIQGNNLLGKIE